MPRPLLLLALSCAFGTATAAPSVQETPLPPAEAAGSDAVPVTPAEREWQSITDDLTPKLVRLRELSEEERRKQTFRAELARIGEFVRRFQATEPDLAASARVFMATQVLWRGLRRDREAVEVLRDVAAQATGQVVAGLAALNAGEILLKSVDETGLTELRELYAARKDADPVFVAALDGLRRQVRIQPGRQFPQLPLKDLAGAPIDAAAWKGSLVVLLVFNVEAPSARAELHGLGAALAKVKDPALRAVGLSLDRDRKLLLDELAKLPVAFPIDCSGMEWEGAAVKELGLTQIPSTIVIDPAGKILFSRIGAVGPELEPLLVEWLAGLRASGDLPARPTGG
ncbi:MAG: TlpA family protein disulfide reductase [Planctomycetes bacterium]|nr:TlpA family protein disulfide reductase [Planctomycetota bacterium]